MADIELTIDDLPPSVALGGAFVPVMIGGASVRYSVDQILDLVRDNAPVDLNTLEKLAASIGDDPSFAATMIAALAGKISAADLPWIAKAIGEVYLVNTALAGAEIPPASSLNSTWIELTAGLTGSGGFNNGKLTSESVSGSAPLVMASATIAVSGSPMNGQSVRLLNTEGRILRPSTSPGTLENDAMQGHRHQQPGNADTVTASGGVSRPSANLSTGSDPVSDGVNGTPRTAIETRMKNIGVKAYMRVK